MISLLGADSQSDCLVGTGPYNTIVEAAELWASAGGFATYDAFHIVGFPPRFKYPDNATTIDKAGSRNKPPKESLAYAIIKACMVGNTAPDSEEILFFRFEGTKWGGFHFILLCLHAHLLLKDDAVIQRQKNAPLVTNADGEYVLYLHEAHDIRGGPAASNPGASSSHNASSKTKQVGSKRIRNQP